MTKAFRFALVAGLGTGIAFLAGCCSTCGECGSSGCDGSCEAPESAAITPTSNTINSTCPFSGGAVKAGVQTVSFHGNEVGFCCEGCVSKFKAMSETDKASLMAKAK
ncbi:MAG: hypothetical protein H6815_05750 [Phycisphaeraceae bacterium]|nr:hypothetical protein [Phycisphaerales bacterium]MCB9859942.1 hypothetical protein [Phycisphaeraceae bacterium]